ncbi:MAG: hypothetical protein SFY70_03120 [Bacteroidia bacterium]|nr:hypothetical protein [Bacteroidia bacterium]
MARTETIRRALTEGLTYLADNPSAEVLAFVSEDARGRKALVYVDARTQKVFLLVREQLGNYRRRIAKWLHMPIVSQERV